MSPARPSCASCAPSCTCTCARPRLVGPSHDAASCSDGAGLGAALRRVVPRRHVARPGRLVARLSVLPSLGFLVPLHCARPRLVGPDRYVVLRAARVSRGAACRRLVPCRHAAVPAHRWREKKKIDCRRIDDALRIEREGKSKLGLGSGPPLRPSCVALNNSPSRPTRVACAARLRSLRAHYLFQRLSCLHCYVSLSPRLWGGGWLRGMRYVGV